ncbi:uroporphyrinogen-III synthase [Geobacillus subterraneus]|uniref:Uroporphyrinogen-III synthase n=2 Tax=Geobacillus TaxID=129337 RepID=A0ABM6AB48_9BACL|nr:MULTISPECIES: uroporphyrinogen-III synthase [Geobacillus]AMX83508.1 uroporphyrinogen-III synthase [Geobacillus subterraneus]KZS26531.1 uroporphyrinogen-III synthase [Geobacillus subterraneus]OXB90529.1 uroporphyrinogen-III synthase [Geobacillus uzenensis]QIZ67869.1 uroporphyrinogen-III synthase [Geobacillus subterraneus]WPZ16868.1 uroporphyrinogen-III synthase [Geobacillus subterraneus]
MRGKRIALCASRKLDEMTALIEKQGGTAVIRPAQGTVFAKGKELGEEMRAVIAMRPDWIVFTTGIGAEALWEAAEREGMAAEWTQTVQETNVAARGYKTVAVLKKAGVIPMTASEDGTTKGLIRALGAHDFAGKKVVAQLYGDTAPALKQFFLARGASYTQLFPYRHVAPDRETLETLYREIIGREVDAVCFTSAMQVRFFFSFAREKQDITPLLEAFRTDVVACAVGKVTQEALEEEGVSRVIAPEHERMGAMIVTLARYFQQ